MTGATGNVGTALLRRLKDAPEVTSIVGLSRRRPDIGVAPYNGVEWREVDIARPASVRLLVEAFTGADAVVHLAWRIQPSHDEPAMRRVNVDGSRHVSEAAIAAGVPQLVVASSVGAYSPGPKDSPVAESWPTGGIHSSPYSRHKSALERGLDAVEAANPDLIVTRVRPGLVFQAVAGSEITRYFFGPLVPARLLGRLRLPVLPLPREFVIPAVHAADLAEAYWVLIRGRHGGAFNVAAEPVLTPDDLARALGAGRAVALPTSVLRAVAALTWTARLQPTDPGWIDLAANCPIMDTGRIRKLGWSPFTSSRQALGELVTAMGAGTGTDSPPLAARRPRR